MLPKPHRLPSPDIRRVFENGKRTNTPLFQFITLKNNEKISRFAIIVPAGLDKRTTVRNRTRRLVREAVRQLMPDVAEGWDVVILVRSTLKGRKMEELHLRDTFKKNGFIHEGIHS